MAQTISIIIPCFNEEAVLPQLFQRLNAAAAQWGVACEFICVDDGSQDRTWALLKAQHDADSRWRCLAFARNFGHQIAVSAGLHHAAGDAVVVMDADLQDPPEEIGRLLSKWREGYEVVFGVRKRRSDPRAKRILAWVYYRLLARLTSFPMPADAGDFCLLDRKVVDVVKALPERSRYLRGLRSWCGFKQAAVEFERDARAAGVPQYAFHRSLKLGLDGVFSFSAAPLRLATYLGFWVSSFAFVGAIFIFLAKVFARQLARFGIDPGPHGIPTLVISVLFLGGVQLICLGILGEYVGRIYEEVKGRPLWIVRESAGIGLTSSPPSGSPEMPRT